MSTYEYNDLFLKAQENGIYHLFVFDIVNSKKMNSIDRLTAQEQMIELMLNMYSHIAKIEKETNSKILVFEENFNHFECREKSTGFGMKVEPFLFGDTFGFTIYRDSLSNENIKNIFDFYYKKFNIKFNFHVANGFYETNDYKLASTKYFRGYCIDVLSNINKPEYKALKKKFSKNN